MFKFSGEIQRSGLIGNLGFDKLAPQSFAQGGRGTDLNMRNISLEVVLVKGKGYTTGHMPRITDDHWRAMFHATGKHRAGNAGQLRVEDHPSQILYGNPDWFIVIAVFMRGWSYLKRMLVERQAAWFADVKTTPRHGEISL
jgi:hypothetical protein